MGLLDDLASLFIDPSASGGGWMAKLAGIGPTASTSTPKQVPGQTQQVGLPPGGGNFFDRLAANIFGPSTMGNAPGSVVARAGSPEANALDANPNGAVSVNGVSYGPQYRSGGTAAPTSGGSGLLGVDSTFAPSSGGLLGNSPIVNAIRDGFVGMSGANGYTGLSAVGAGATAATRYNQNRRAFDIQNKLAGQQYAQGNLGILSGQIGLAKTLAQFKDAGLLPKDATLADLANSGLMMGQGDGSTAGGNSSSAAPASQEVQGPISPTVGHGQPESTWDYSAPNQPASVTGAMARPALASTAGAAYAGGGDPTLSSNDPNSPAVAAKLKQDALLWGQPFADMVLKRMTEGLPYMRAVEQIKAESANVSDRPGSITRRNGVVVGEAPTLQQIQDPNGPPGQKILAQVYPSSGRVVPVGTGNAGGSTGGSTGGTTPASAGGNPPGLYTAMAYVESHFDPKAISPAGAQGFMQFMPGTAKQMGGNPADAGQSVQMAQKYVGQLQQKYQGSLPIALAAYNWGEGNIDKWLAGGADPSKLPRETQNYVARVLDLSGSGGAPSQGGHQAGGSQGSGGTISAIGPAQEASLKARGEHLEGTFGAEVDTEADNAKQQNFLLDQMRQESQPWSMGPTAPYLGEMRRWTNALFPKNKEIADLVGNWQAFNKNAMELTRVAVRGTSSKAAVQEFTMIQSALPGDTMSRPAFDHIADQLSSVNDYRLAKQTAASQWRQEHGTLEGFDTDFNRNASPGAFLLLRMKPEDVQTMAANLQKTDSGRATLQRLAAETQFAMSLGFGGNQ